MAKLGKAEELKIWELFTEGVSQRKISEKLGISTSTVHKYVKIMKNPDYEPPRGIASEELSDLETKLNKIEKDNLSHEEKMEKAFELAIDMLYVTANKRKEEWIIEDERRVQIPLKTIMDCIEKAGKHAKTMSEAAKAAKQGITPETIDYQEMAKLYVSFNEETGKFDYDAKKHMQEVLDKAYKKDS